MEGWIQLGLDALLLVGFVGAVFLWFTSEPGVGARKAAGTAAILLLFAFAGALSAVIVPAGSVGVVMEFGKVHDEELQPGIHFRLPFVNSVTNVDTRVQGIHFKDLGAASREYQDVILSGTLNVHVDPQRASELFQNVGLDYAAKIVLPFYGNLVKEVIPKYGIGEVLPQREAIRRETVEKLTAKLLAYGVIVDDVALENIAFSEAYTKAIEEKQVQEQRVQTERQILEQRRIQAEQAVVAAQGAATANIETARGQAEANRLLTESLSELLIQYTQIQKLNPNVQVILVPDNGNFLINPDSFRNPNPTPAP